ncbi:hypothetical protein M9H77_30188 [Catharanthus roseus]|uniref:Uncharacterized protein n=1 Tax=Catharanthus roseus TaxID=4058 RepID=A0ACB9ZXG5_CATRO|nr:hypothetical protein M9H77_30188 [Catharanthus roseus]
MAGSSNLTYVEGSSTNRPPLLNADCPKAIEKEKGALEAKLEAIKKKKKGKGLIGAWDQDSSESEGEEKAKLFFMVLESEVPSSPSNFSSSDDDDDDDDDDDPNSMLVEMKEIFHRIIPRVDEYYDNVANYAYCILGIENEGWSMDEELGTVLEDSSISLSLNPSLSFHEVSFVELKSLWVSYTLHVGILSDICVICFDGNVFLLIPCMNKCLSSHTSLEDSLMHSGAKFIPSCYSFGMLDDTSFVDPYIVGFELNYALFDILHDEYLGKFIKEVDYAFPFLGAFMKDLDGLISSNQCFHLFSDQFEFSYIEHKISSVVNSLNLFENRFGFKFYHLYFKDFLLKGFGIIVQFRHDESFYFHLTFKDVSNNSFLKDKSKKMFLKSFILKSISKTFEGTLLIWKLELLQHFMFFILKDLENLSLQFHGPFEDFVRNVVTMFDLQDVYTFTYAFIGRSLVIFECSCIALELSRFELL